MSIRVLISGASIAGPALAYWLHRYGYSVTVVEKSSAIRTGGQAVDFKGPIHEAVLRKMGILDAVRQASVTSEDGTLVNARGRTVGRIPGAFAGGQINIPRGDLATILYDLTKETCEYLFDESVASITENADSVDVTFAHSGPRTFDIVVGADGIHSHVRTLTFGPERDHVTHLGHYYVLAGLTTGDDDDVMFNQPGIMASLGGSKAPAFIVFASPLLPPARDDVDTQKTQVAHALRDGRWRIPELIAGLPSADDFFMDSISRVTMDRYSRGRVVLVGDAAYGNALGGFGTGLAIVGAYVLAGELHRADGDHPTAFARYEDAFRGYASISQKVNAGRLLAPATPWGIVLRNLLFTSLFLVGPLMRIIDRPASNLTLEDYDQDAPADAGVRRRVTRPRSPFRPARRARAARRRRPGDARS